MVAESFMGTRPESMNVCHNNGDPTDNRLANLRYDTQSENRRDTVRHGNDHEANKTHCSRGHRLERKNFSPSSLRKGRRECLACARARSRVNHYPSLKSEMQKIADSYYSAIETNNPF